MSEDTRPASPKQISFIETMCLMLSISTPTEEWTVSSADRWIKTHLSSYNAKKYESRGRFLGFLSRECANGTIPDNHWTF